MNLRNKCQIFLLNFKKFDMYGQKLELWVNSERMVKSKFGAFISMIVISLCLYLFIENINSWNDKKNFQTISSSQSLAVSEMLLKNESFSYDFNHTNFNIYFGVTATFLNGSMMNWEQLEKYVIQSFEYQNQFGESNNFDFEKCKEANRLEFLDLDIVDNSISNWTVCLSKNYEMGLFTDKNKMIINMTNLSYKISLCKNSTQNNYSCASYSEIAEILKYVQVQVSLPKSVYDFNNPDKIRKKTFEYQFYHLDLNLKKIFSASLIPIYLQTDEGIYEELYKLNTVDFNVEKILYETLLREKNNDLLFIYDLSFGFDQQIYIQKNQKIFILFANFGGIMNFLFLLGKIICYFYNRTVYLHQLINISFTNLEKYNEDKTMLVKI